MAVPARADVVIVGAGLAGGALATALARGGLGVVLLERQRAYRDRVRGENMKGWGAAELASLGLLDVLVEAGGHWVPRLCGYTWSMGDFDAAEANAGALDGLVPGIAGDLNMPHVAATEALARAAETAGASVVRGVTAVEVSAGDPPRVGWTQGGARAELTPRLIVGADGRSSVVRSQVGIARRTAGPLHFIAGQLIEQAPGWPDDLIGIGADHECEYLVFPQGGGRHRVYVCHANEDARRFAGPSGSRRLLDDLQRTSALPAGRLDGATIAGPCASFPGDQSWCERPFAPGVVLAGDAGGHDDPINGQGQSLAMRDVRALVEVLLDPGAWTFEGYARARTERLEKMRFVSRMASVLRLPYLLPLEARVAARERMVAAPELGRYLSAMRVGPEAVEEDAFGEEVARAVFGDDAAVDAVMAREQRTSRGRS